jgi:DNA-binding NtrC family response regulator
MVVTLLFIAVIGLITQARRRRRGLVDFRSLALLQAPDTKVELASALRERGWDVKPVTSLDSSEGYDGCDVGVVVFDSQMPFELVDLEQFTASLPLEWIAVLDARFRKDPGVLRLVRNNFFDYHSLPLDVDRLNVVLGHAYGRAQLGREIGCHAGAIRIGSQMVGDSPVMLELFRALDKVARADAPVLISGESGTGKELAARTIHANSARKKGPFVPVNCGALPPGLIQSELFGHEKGAFTGAHQRKIGSIEAAAGGVVFLDEIGDLAPELQANLLRFLQERTIVRVGSVKQVPIDVRVIAASHVDLLRAVREERFREDLYYRLNVLHLEVPPLRARGSDITLLAEAVFEQYRHYKSAQVRGFALDARRAMELYSWPGNVRELINRVQQAMIMCEGRLITAHDLGLGLSGLHESTPPRISLQSARHSTEKDVILRTLLQNQHNVSAAARQLGVSRVTLYRMIDKFKIDLRMSDGGGGK